VCDICVCVLVSVSHRWVWGPSCGGIALSPGVWRKFVWAAALPSLKLHTHSTHTLIQLFGRTQTPHTHSTLLPDSNSVETHGKPERLSRSWCQTQETHSTHSTADWETLTRTAGRHGKCSSQSTVRGNALTLLSRRNTSPQPDWVANDPLRDWVNCENAIKTNNFINLN